ncbi:host-nuclease inhibitor Gam family protein [Azospirillum thermophilum]|uniref:Uncharacterized protein n=1 Tax=Azospirillum thermophilum TaxID=2202148 RepID=A0A2S2D0V4_9PROT|nr:host-nuclease inhibitor Gam family protein [Azospirillum thermophilum]AWK90318.1 hypothetical protein DEW08_30345 [Azospirillum thermophilum]
MGSTPTDTAIRDADEASRVLAEIGEINRGLARITTELVGGITALRTAADTRAAPLAARKERLSSQLEQWARAERARLGPTIILPAGRLEWRTVPMIGRINDHGAVFTHSKSPSAKPTAKNIICKTIADAREVFVIAPS